MIWRMYESEYTSKAKLYLDNDGSLVCNVDRDLYHLIVQSNPIQKTSHYLFLKI